MSFENSDSFLSFDRKGLGGRVGVPMDVVVTYEHLGDSIPLNEVIAKNDDDSYSIRHLDEIVPSTMTCISYFEGTVLDLDLLYAVLPCLPRDHGLNLSELTNPVVTSVRWDGHVKGQMGGFFPSNIFVDVQIGDLFASTRINRKCIQIAGVKSKATARLMTEFVIQMMNKALSTYELLKRDWLVTMKASDWLTAYSAGERVYVPVPEVRYESIDHLISWPVRVPEQYLEVCSAIRDCYVDLKLVSEINLRTKYILNSTELMTVPAGSVTFTGVLLVSMINLTIDLFFGVNRKLLMETLRYLGQPAFFFNTKSHEVTVNYVDETNYPDDVLIRRKGRKLYETLAKITERGKITITGSGGTRLENSFIELMTSIIRACEMEPDIIIGG